ncbi:ribonuclease H-like domain-containing protein [Nanoarchaeota archaeon]
MIQNTFMLLPGISYRTERSLWHQNILSWNDFLGKDNVGGIGNARKLHCDKQLKKAKSALHEDNASFFFDKLPLSEHWRLYNHFKEDAAFLDIETCGGYGYVTVIGIYDGYDVKHFVRGANLSKEAINKELAKYKMLITFNGSSFDIPVINRYFNEVVPEVPHMDLRHLCARLGFTGGLKLVEQQLSIRRKSDVEGLSGGDAVMLWDRFRATKDDKYLQQLLDYNAEDIINLKPIADYATTMMTKKILPAELF